MNRISELSVEDVEETVEVNPKYEPRAVRMLRLFREFYQFYVTQTHLGANHHHPIWEQIAVILETECVNDKKMTQEEYQFITGPYYQSLKIRENNEDLFQEDE